MFGFVKNTASSVVSFVGNHKGKIIAGTAIVAAAAGAYYYYNNNKESIADTGAVDVDVVADELLAI